MMRTTTLKLSAILAAALIAVSSAASAATLSIVGNPIAETSLPGNFGSLRTADGTVDRNDALFRDNNGNLVLPAGQPAAFGLSVFNSSNGAGGGLALSGKSEVTFTYLGFEAGNTNTFSSNEFGGAFFANKGAAASGFGDTITALFDSGVTPFLLDFVFSTSGGGGQSAENAGSIASGLTLAFGPLFNNGKSVFAFLGDGAGDSDFDDMVVRIDVTAVPVPAALPLLVGGLGVLGFVARRRKRTA
ncbi:VPLPA-CTERM sorting domain-containing protein [Roseibium aggregatum]|nr:VPLPA-CTERM sorting domain-containing protein [Roseibium aggregatum]